MVGLDPAALSSDQFEPWALSNLLEVQKIGVVVEHFDLKSWAEIGVWFEAFWSVYLSGAAHYLLGP